MLRTIRRYPAGLLATAALAAGAEPAHAAPAPCADARPPRLEIHPGKLFLSGRIGEADTFASSLRITAHAPKLSIALRASRLTAVAESDRPAPDALGRPRITVTAPSGQLVKETINDIPVKVEAIQAAGRYEGAIYLRSGKSRCTIPLIVNAHVRPKVSLVPADRQAIEIDVTRPRPVLDGAADEFVTFKTLLANVTDEPAEIVSATVGLRGGDDELEPETGVRVELPADETRVSVGDVAELGLLIDRGELSPDHYTGAVVIRLAGATEATSLALDLDVKDAWLWPVVTLLVGFALSYLPGTYRRLSERAEIRDRLRRARRAINSTNPADGWLVQRLIDEAERALDDREIARARELAGKIETSRRCLARAREIYLEAWALSAGNPPPEITNNLKLVRANIGDGQPDAADGHLSTMETALDALRAPAGQGAVVHEVRAAFGMGGLPAAARILQSVAPTAQLGVVATSYGGLLVAVLLFLGLKELYLDASTFGDDWLLDYGSLLVWALGATVGIKSFGERAAKQPA